VVDGDTLRIEGIPVRLNAIDAPEEDQLCQRDGRPWRCGDRSTEALRALADGHLMVCITAGTYRYRRISRQLLGDPHGPRRAHGPAGLGARLHPVL
jgi:endonuclease YncB( thermonuclease family)